jgi:hypothetical protein
MAPWSTRADAGSDRRSSNDTLSTSENEAEDDPVWESSINTYLNGIPTGSNPFSGKTSEEPDEARTIEARQNETASYIRDFDRAVLYGDKGSVGVLPSIQVFWQRVPVPGEQRPWRAVDGVSATQPRRRTRTNTHPSSIGGQDGTSDEPSPPPPQPPSMSSPPMFTSTFDSLSLNEQQKGKSQMPPHVDSDKISPLVTSPVAQKQHHLPTSGYISSALPALQQGASLQQFSQECQLPSSQPWIPQGSADYQYSSESSLLLPNNVMWHPQQGLFEQERSQQHYAGPILSHSVPSSNPLLGITQAGVTSGQNSHSPYRDSPQSSSQSNYNSDSNTLGMTFDTTPSHQAYPLAFDHPSNYIPLHSRVQAQGNDQRLDTPQTWIRPALREGSNRDEYTAGKEGWEDLVNFDAHPNSE